MPQSQAWRSGPISARPTGYDVPNNRNDPSNIRTGFAPCFGHTVSVLVWLNKALVPGREVDNQIHPVRTGGSDRVTYTYNCQSQVTGVIDQMGTVRALSYDWLGALLSDTVTSFGGGVDTTTGKIETAYNERRLVIRSTSYSGTTGSIGTVINEVTYVYNGFNQLVTEYQEHAGAVDPATSSKVQYTYADGTGNTIRPTGVIYPDGTSIVTVYSAGMADAISRPDTVGEGSTVLSSWSFLGLGTVVVQNYNAASGAELTMQNGGTGDAGDKYTGLDRFGRLVETIWQAGSASLVHTKYGRNRVGGVTWQNNVKAHDLSVATEDNYYWYDGLQQVTRHDRGDLTPPSGPPYTGIDPSTRRQMENFTFDETGNWTNEQIQTPPLIQNRTHNTANQILTITGPAGVIQPSFDPAGNMTATPQPGDWTSAFGMVWDAWNRLTTVLNGTDTVAAYGYDALTRRVTVATPSETRDFYYDKQWRALEESVSGSVKAEYVWSPFDRWNLIRRTRSVSGTLDETRFVLKDYLDPSAIIDPSAAVTERYRYDAFGPVNILAPDFSARDTSECAWNFLFHAEFLDTDTGFYNYGYRYYDPVTGRWLSRDPIEEQGGLNLYTFVGNDGLDNWDYLGLNDQGIIPIGDGKCKDAAGERCCCSQVKTIYIYQIKPFTKDHTVGHAFVSCPSIGSFGQFPKPGCFKCKFHGDGDIENNDDLKILCDKRPERCTKEEFAACPKSVKKVKERVKRDRASPPKYGLGPGGDPNCREWADDVLRGAGFSPSPGWIPGM